MPRYTHDGYTKVAWATVADKNFVTLSELTAGEDLECDLTGDGLNIAFSENSVDDSALCEAFDAALPGTYGVNPELTYKRRNTENGDTDAMWNLFNERNESGALVVRRGIPSSTDWAAGQPVEVYPARVGIRKPAASTRNTQVNFMVTFFGSEEPALDGIVVAS